MVFNATFNDILVISWQSVLLVEETGVPGETEIILGPYDNFLQESNNSWWQSISF